MTANGCVVITAIGMSTPVGLTAAQSCAAIRAGISAIADLDFTVEVDLVERVAVPGCTVPSVTQGYSGLGRAMRLATAAIRDLSTNAGLRPADLKTASLHLAVGSPTRGNFDSRVTTMLGQRLANSLDADGLESRTRSCAEGHAAGAIAVREALEFVRGGVSERAIVCGVDSLVEPDTLQFYHDKRRVKTADHVDGFIPGEAAACILLERDSMARRRGTRALAVVEAPSVAREPVTIWSDEPSSATGLSEAIQGTFEQLSDAGRDTRLVIGDLNGETYRAKEFGNAAARVLSAIPAALPTWHVADCLGDTGGAAFTISMCLGAQALAKGYAKSDRILVFGASDDGLRGAVSLRRFSGEV